MKLNMEACGVCDRCTEDGVSFNEDGEWLCEDCIFSDAIDEAMPGIVRGDT